MKTYLVNSYFSISFFLIITLIYIYEFEKEEQRNKDGPREQRKIKRLVILTFKFSSS